MRPNRIEIMAWAIMRFEGYYKGSMSYNHNNPGNLKFARQLGATPDVDGNAVFSAFSFGWDALVNQLTLAATGKSKIYRPNMTLIQFFAIYAKENLGYAEFVASELHVPITTKLKELR